MPAPRLAKLKARPEPSDPVAMRAFRGVPFSITLELDRTRPTATGWEALTFEIRNAQLDDSAPLAVVTQANPTGAGPFTADFTGAQTNQDLSGEALRRCWLVGYFSKDDGETLDVVYAGRLDLMESGVSQMAAAPPNTVGPASRAELEALEEIVDTLTTAQSSFVAGGVVLRRDGSADAYYNPLEDSAAGRGAALETALITAQLTPLVKAQIMVGRGDFLLTNSMASINPALNSTISFAEGAALVYDDQEDAGFDYPFFRSTTRNVANFGAVGAAHAEALTDNWSAFQAAANSLGPNPNAPDAVMESGRRFRTGAIIIPPGRYGFSQTWEVSATVLVTGAGAAATNLFFMANSATDAGEEMFLLSFPVPTTVDWNNCFGTGLRDIILAGARASNAGGSGVKISGGQGTHFCNVFVLDFGLRGVDGLGLHFEGLCWIADITRGPGLDWDGGGSAGQISVEHVNASGATGPDGLRYPAVLIGGGTYHIGALLGEEGGGNPQTLCRATGCISLVIGTVAMGVASGSTRSHVLLDLRGTTRASVQHIYGSFNGGFEINPGTLVHDISTHSPLGSGVAYTLTGVSASYDQRLPFGALATADAAPAGTLTGTTLAANVVTASIRTLGNAATALQGDGLTVTSNLGDLNFYAGRIECTRAVFYLNYNRTALDISNGVLTIDALGRIIPNLPTSAAGLPTGALWKDGASVKVA